MEILVAVLITIIAVMMIGFFLLVTWTWTKLNTLNLKQLFCEKENKELRHELAVQSRAIGELKRQNNDLLDAFIDTVTRLLPPDIAHNITNQIKANRNTGEGNQFNIASVYGNLNTDNLYKENVK